MFNSVGIALVSLLIGGAGGTVFYWLHMPLPWTLGSLTASAIVAIAGGRWQMPMFARTFARPFVGVIAGSAFTPAVAAAALAWWDSILVVALYTILTTILGYFFFWKVARFDRTTAFFCSSPGGLGEMVLLGGSVGAHMGKIVLAHIARIVVVVFTVPIFLQILLGHPIGKISPFENSTPALSIEDVALLCACALAGYTLGRVLRFANGMMLFSLMFSAAAHVTGLTDAVLPIWVSALMQILIGAVTGARFADIRWHEARQTIVMGVIWAFAALFAAMGAAWLATTFVERPFLAMMLALAPGGMVEMTVITFALGIEVAFVVTCQVSRILLVITLMPLSWRLIAPTEPPRPSD